MIHIDCRDLSAHLQSLHGSIFSAILNESPDWIYIKDANSRFLYSNKSHLKHLGLKAAQLIGLNDLELYPARLSSVFYADETRLFDNRIPIVKVEPNHENGQEMLVVTIKQVIVNKHDANLGLMGISRRLAVGDENSIAQTKKQVIDMLNNDIGADVTSSQMRAFEAQLCEYFGSDAKR